jgi:hypothetical protein
MSANRPQLACCQKANFAGQWWVVTLDDSCANFCPSKNHELGFPDARQIPLTQGKYAIVDADDYYRLAKFNWYAVPGNRTFYASKKMAQTNINMHRLIMDAPKNLVVDHIDHNGLNNRKSNLRICTNAQNACNMRPYRGVSSKYKGVSWSKKKKKWEAGIKRDQKRYRLGFFETEIEAAKAYDKKASQLHGQFACLNFPAEK